MRAARKGAPFEPSPDPETLRRRAPSFWSLRRPGENLGEVQGVQVWGTRGKKGGMMEREGTETRENAKGGTMHWVCIVLY